MERRNAPTSRHQQDALTMQSGAARTPARCVGSGLPLFMQAKLAIGATDDPLEHEADRVAQQALAAPMDLTGGNAPLPLQRVTGSAGGAVGTAPASVERVLSGAGRALEPALQQDMEQRFGHDFSAVRVHADGSAEQSAQDVNACAYTVGCNVVFGAGQFAPATHAGRHLLAHELAHVLQQSAAVPTAHTLQRFSDVDHHIIEEAALKKLFTPDQLAAIEKGNMQRDYSQTPIWLNALALGQATRFGGYKAYEHFDNFIFDRAQDRWVSQAEFDKLWDDHSGQWVARPLPVAQPGKPRPTAPQYIESQLLAAVQDDMPDTAAFEHLGNAFHTIEDFFAHSNFVELAQGDTTHGIELATHASHVHGPSSEDAILGTISDPASSAYLTGQFRDKQAAASPLSHGRLAKDFHGNPNHALAITLAALVIRQMALMLKEAFALKTRAQREACVRDVVMATLNRYLRPPSDKDTWWTSLLAEDRGVMRRKIGALQQVTPVTVNQTPASPLRNIEATRYSSWKPIGTSLSFSIGEGKFLTVGHMLYLPGTGGAAMQTGLMLPPYVSDKDERVRLVSGFQFSGSFDENKWFK